MHDITRNRNVGLDPETQYAEIYRNIATLEFPWDFTQALSFALFRTYAVPSIGRLLDQTGEFNNRPQKRYDDTVLLLDAPLTEGFESINGRQAMRRINGMHRMYDISNDDMRYVLSTFVVVPQRWIEAYGWRPLAWNEQLAAVRYYQDLGRHMGIKDIPETYTEFEDLMDSYEQEHFAYDPANRRVADATMKLMASFYPAPLHRAIDLFSLALMEPDLLDAFGFEEPGRIVRKVVGASLRLRARFVRLLPPRRKPITARDLPRIKSYPGGFNVADLGTFHHGAPEPSDKIEA